MYFEESLIVITWDLSKSHDFSRNPLSLGENDKGGGGGGSWVPNEITLAVFRFLSPNT